MSRLTVTVTCCICICSTLLGGKITTEKLQTECHNSEDIKCKLQCSVTVNLNNENIFITERNTNMKMLIRKMSGVS